MTEQTINRIRQFTADRDWDQFHIPAKLAKGNGLKTIAFPLISAGVYGYPQRDSIRVAIETMKLHQDDFDEITLVLFGEREYGFAREDYSEFF